MAITSNDFEYTEYNILVSLRTLDDKYNVVLYNEKE